jgi:uncharacterized protein DUF11
VRLRLLLLVLASALSALLLVGLAGNQYAFGAHQGKKQCRYVKRKIRGKTKRVRVCTAVPKRPAPAPQADLVVAAVAPLEVFVGQVVDYHVTVVNRGPQVARELSLAIDSPVALAKVHASLTPGQAASCDAVGPKPGAFRCRMDTLPANGRWLLEFAGPAKAVGELRFAVAVRSTTADPVDRNSAVQVLTTVAPKPAGG